MQTAPPSLLSPPLSNKQFQTQGFVQREGTNSLDATEADLNALFNVTDEERQKLRCLEK